MKRVVFVLIAVIGFLVSASVRGQESKPGFLADVALRLAMQAEFGNHNGELLVCSYETMTARRTTLNRTGQSAPWSWEPCEQRIQTKPPVVLVIVCDSFMMEAHQTVFTRRDKTKPDTLPTVWAKACHPDLITQPGVYTFTRGIYRD